MAKRKRKNMSTKNFQVLPSKNKTILALEAFALAGLQILIRDFKFSPTEANQWLTSTLAIARANRNGTDESIFTPVNYPDDRVMELFSTIEKSILELEKIGRQ